MPALRLPLILLLAVLAVPPSWGANEVATINAFEALLSLPETQPEEGDWQHEAPEGFDGGDEEGLIRWLAKQRKAGADFNQTRHRGTLLHHAIRGGLEKTARWLLANGGDPLAPLTDGDNAPDSLALAVRYRRWSVMDALLKMPAVNNSQRGAQLLSAWQAAEGTDEAAVINKLLARSLAIPDGESGEKLLALALERHWLKLVVALTERGTVRAATAWRRYSVAPPGKLASAADIEVADARLAAPIFPYLPARLGGPRDIDQLWKLHLRRPFEDPDFTRLVVEKAIAAPISPALKRGFLERLPRNSLLAALDDDQILQRWAAWSAKLGAADGEWALAILGDLPRRRPEPLLQGLLAGNTWFSPGPGTANLAAAWGRLLARLAAPLPPSVDGKLWMAVPAEHRPALLALAYRPSREELSNWLHSTDKESLRTSWPRLKATLPHLAGSIHGSLLARYTPDNPNACSGEGVPPETLERARILLAGGAKPRQPVVLDSGCRSETAGDILQALEKAGLVSPAAPAPGKRFVQEKPACRFQPRGPWRQALAREFLGSELIGIQAVAYPGEEDCALLLWAGEGAGRVFYEEEEFTGTRQGTACADSRLTATLWRDVGQALEQRRWPASLPDLEGVLPVQDTRSGQHLLLAGAAGPGPCTGPTPPALLAWEKDGGKDAFPLGALPRSDPVMQAFLQQCRPSEAWTCIGGPGADEHPEHGKEKFVDRYWAGEGKAFVDAVLALDYEALRGMREAGLFPHWLARAIKAVTQSGLPLEEKRRRTAWLFRDGPLLKATLETNPGLAEQFIPWLPREDWQPVIKALQGRSGWLESLRKEAERQGKKTLACRLATALQKTCNAGGRPGEV